MIGNWLRKSANPRYSRARPPSPPPWSAPAPSRRATPHWCPRRQDNARAAYVLDPLAAHLGQQNVRSQRGIVFLARLDPLLADRDRPHFGLRSDRRRRRPAGARGHAGLELNQRVVKISVWPRVASRALQFRPARFRSVAPSRWRPGEAVADREDFLLRVLNALGEGFRGGVACWRESFARLGVIGIAARASRWPRCRSRGLAEHLGQEIAREAERFCGLRARSLAGTATSEHSSNSGR